MNKVYELTVIQYDESDDRNTYLFYDLDSLISDAKELSGYDEGNLIEVDFENKFRSTGEFNFEDENLFFSWREQEVALTWFR